MIQGAEDRNLGWFLPLHEAIPELAGMDDDEPENDSGPSSEEPVSPTIRPVEGGSTEIRTQDQRIKNPLL
jgi:hypothetical protein